MGKARIALLAALVFGLIGLASQARAASLTDPGVPHTINLQSMVYDSEGKVTTSESVDMTIRIVDADNNVLFSEAQNGVTVVKGAINVNIGEASGGVPLDILDPSTGIKLIDIEIAGQSPFELMPLGALPYSMWAEKALTVANDSIGTEQIKNGSIKAEDIDPLDFSAIQGIAGEGQIPTSMATDAELTAHASSTAAHPASAIVVSGSFVTFVADDVQEALFKLDAKLVDEIVNRQNGQTTLTTNLSNHTVATTGVHGVGAGNVVGTTLTQTLTNKTLTSPTIGDFTNATHDHQNAAGGGTLDGAAIASGTIADVRLSANVSKLGSSIESSEIADDSIVDADINSAAAIAWSKVDKTGAVPGDVGAAPAAHDHAGTYVPVASQMTTCAMSIRSNIIDGSVDDITPGGDSKECRVYGMVVDFGTGATAMAGQVSVTNIQDQGISEKNDQNNVIAIQDDSPNKMLFLLAHAGDNNPSIGGLAIGQVPGATCPVPSEQSGSLVFLVNNGTLSDGNCVVDPGDVTLAKSSPSL